MMLEILTWTGTTVLVTIGAMVTLAGLWICKLLFKQVFPKKKADKPRNPRRSL